MLQIQAHFSSYSQIYILCVDMYGLVNWSITKLMKEVSILVYFTMYPNCGVLEVGGMWKSYFTIKHIVFSPIKAQFAIFQQSDQ